MNGIYLFDFEMKTTEYNKLLVAGFARTSTYGPGEAQQRKQLIQKLNTENHFEKPLTGP